MAKLNARDHLLHHLQEIVLGPLPDLSGCQCGGRVGDEEGAEPLMHLGLSDHRLDPIGQINDLFPTGSTDLQEFSHGPELRSGAP